MSDICRRAHTHGKTAVLGGSSVSACPAIRVLEAVLRGLGSVRVLPHSPKLGRDLGPSLPSFTSRPST